MKLCEINSSSVIKKLRNIFSRVGIPEILRSDNGPQFSSQEFRKFTQSWNFQYITSSPYYPKSNGLAERYVQTIKNLLERCILSISDPYLAMLELRNTQKTNEKSHAEYASGHQLRSITPVHKNQLKVRSSNAEDFTSKWQESKRKQATYYNKHSKNLKELCEGERVRVFKEKKWKPAIVEAKTNHPRSYIVQTGNGKELRRNRVHIRSNDEREPIHLSDDDNSNDAIETMQKQHTK